MHLVFFAHPLPQRTVVEPEIRVYSTEDMRVGHVIVDIAWEQIFAYRFCVRRRSSDVGRIGNRVVLVMSRQGIQTIRLECADTNGDEIESGQLN